MTDPTKRTSPTVPRSPAPNLAHALERNIDALVARRAAERRGSSREERAADAITGFAGSMMFVYIHLAAFGFWIACNIGLIPFVQPWDPSLVVLAMAASVEAIFLSTFVLISQNRMAAEDNRRADLDLQISLLNEHETTRLLQLTSAIAKRLDIDTDFNGEMDELTKDVAPEAVLNRIEEGNSRAEEKEDEAGEATSEAKAGTGSTG